MADFPAHLFRMDGDPGAIRASAGKWSSFGSAATEASADITRIDTGEFIGPEGDLFRHGLNKDMPGHLQITGEAFGKVATGLTTFASTLESLQDQMRPIAQRAPGLWAALQAAQGRVDRAHTADQTHQQQVAQQPPDATQPDTYHSDSTAAAAGVFSQAQREWQDCVDQANGLRGQLGTAIHAAAQVIVEAKGMRFKENPKWWDIGGQFTNFVRANTDLLKKLSGALKIVSLVSGLLSFIPVLAPVMGPIALATGLAAAAIDLSVYAATGEGSLKTILIDVGLNLIPFAGKGLRAIIGEVKVTKLGAVIRDQNFGFARRIVITTEDSRFSQLLPRGTKWSGGTGTTAGPSLGAAPRALSPLRSTSSSAYRGMRVSLSEAQNKLAHGTLTRLEEAGARDIRVDQAQLDTALNKVGTNRPDIQGSLDNQRVHFEYDRPPGDRVQGHVDTITNNDPSSIVITVPHE